jgi:hypothetical protein
MTTFRTEIMADNQKSPLRVDLSPAPGELDTAEERLVAVRSATLHLKPNYEMRKSSKIERREESNLYS